MQTIRFTPFNYAVKLFRNVLFLIQTFWICFTEIPLYFFTKNYDLFIKRFTKRLASINILYVKVFQSLALNNSIINDNLNNELLKFADNAPFTKDDIDYDTLLRVSNDYNIVFNDGVDKPVNSGMISLVYLATCKYTTNSIIIKIKRKNIDKRLQHGIDNLLFFVNLLKFIPFFNNYKISENIQNNIDIIKEQTNFGKEIENIKRMKKNCKNLDYIKIPYVYDNINNDFTNLIAMSYIKGKRFNEIDKEDYIEFAKQVIKFGIVTSLIHGFSHGDFHVGNILFIKEDSESASETEISETTKPKYKLGIIDFGIITEIKEPFKSNLLNCLTSLFQESSIVFLNKFLNSGIFEPCLIKDVLPQDVYDNLINATIHLAEEFLYSNNLKQIHLFEFFKIFFAFISKNNATSENNSYNLSKYGIVLSEDFVLCQLTLAMANGVTFALCQDKTLQITNDVVNDLFHTKLFME
jgi:predicted unusual protein kinase regulating ubiquinone biosynthesis (AarF/ABC1/UbiB family)